jgi:hypothetical protein
VLQWSCTIAQWSGTLLAAGAFLFLFWFWLSCCVLVCVEGSGGRVCIALIVCSSRRFLLHALLFRGRGGRGLA